MNKEPTFEEGPFFYISFPVSVLSNKRFVIWATDTHTARSVIGMKTNYSIAYIYPKLIGSLTDVKRDYRLSSAQISDLHREGYLRL